MSGHSKWATIKRAKGKTDAARGKVFTKIGREIAVAVKLGGGDPASNSKLRDVISKAKAANMPNDNIQRSIKKASGELGSINYESISYEGYGVNGVAVIVETLTDNKNRTASDVRHIFDKCGGSMGTNGCVSYVSDGLYEITTLPSVLSQVRETLESKGFTLVSAEIEKIPANTVDLDGAGLEKFTKMLDMFDDNDDVQNVFHNANLPDDGEEE